MMNIHTIPELIHGAALNVTGKTVNYTCAFTSDLMSDVLGLSEIDDIILITGLSTLQTIRTAEISNIGCIIIGRDKKVTDEMIQLAEECSITLITSPLTLFEISGMLYTYGIKPIE